jgi:hypothetical protein
MRLHLDREREREQRDRHAGVGDCRRVEALGRGDPHACGEDVGAGERARSYCLSGDDTLVTDARDGTFKKWLEDRYAEDLAKALGHALVAGGGAAHIHERTMAAVSPDEADALKRTFWAQCPAAGECRGEWRRRIERGRTAGEGFIVRFGGWTPARCSANDLRLLPRPTLSCWTSTCAPRSPPTSAG